MSPPHGNVALHIKSGWTSLRRLSTKCGQFAVFFFGTLPLLGVWIVNIKLFQHLRFKLGRGCSWRLNDVVVAITWKCMASKGKRVNVIYNIVMLAVYILYNMSPQSSLLFIFIIICYNNWHLGNNGKFILCMRQNSLNIIVKHDFMGSVKYIPIGLKSTQFFWWKLYIRMWSHLKCYRIILLICRLNNIMIV